MNLVFGEEAVGGSENFDISQSILVVFVPKLWLSLAKLASIVISN